MNITKTDIIAAKHAISRLKEELVKLEYAVDFSSDDEAILLGELAEPTGEYMNKTSDEAKLFKVRYTVNYEDGRSEIYETAARGCRMQAFLRLHEKGVEYITIGFTRNHVTLHRSGVSSVIFYDCFYLPPEEPEMIIEKQAYDYVCEAFLPLADVSATTHAEYVTHVNRGSFKTSFDKRSSK